MVMSRTTVLSGIYDATGKPSLASITMLLSDSAWLSTTRCDLWLMSQDAPSTRAGGPVHAEYPTEWSLAHFPASCCRLVSNLVCG